MTDLVNRYSLLYFAIGLFFYFVRTDWVIAIVSITTFEALINIYRRSFTQTDLLISGTNIVIFMVGWYIGYLSDKYGFDHQNI